MDICYNEDVYCLIVYSYIKIIGEVDMDNKKKKSFGANRYEKRNNEGRSFKENKLNSNKNNFETEEAEETGLVIGRNAVRELLKSEREIDKILVQKGEREGSIVVLVAMAIEKGIPVIETDKNKLDSMSGFAPHQGIIAMASEKEYCSVEDILNIAKERGEAPLVVIADGITDPYNLGALIRCAEGAGALGIIIPKRRSTGLTPHVT